MPPATAAVPRPVGPRPAAAVAAGAPGAGRAHAGGGRVQRLRRHPHAARATAPSGCSAARSSRCWTSCRGRRACRRPLQAGDIIVGLGNSIVDSPQSAARELRRHEPGRPDQLSHQARRTANHRPGAADLDARRPAGLRGQRRAGGHLPGDRVRGLPARPGRPSGGAVLRPVPAVRALLHDEPAGGQLLPGRHHRAEHGRLRALHAAGGVPATSSWSSRPRSWC